MEVRAQLNNYRRSPRKVRLLADMLKGLDVSDAENQLDFTVKGSSADMLKLLKSAVANAENNFGLAKDNLFIKEICVDEGAKLKRWLPRAYGRASLILKRVSYINIIIAEKVEGKGRKQVKKQTIKDVKEEKAATKELKSTEKEKARERKAEKEEKEFSEEVRVKGEAVKSLPGSKQGFLKKVFRRKSM